MVTVPLGVGAYKRQYAGEPEVKCVNRFMETSPVNLREHIALLSRAGTNQLIAPGSGKNRGQYFKKGLFNGDLFTCVGSTLYRYNATTGLIAITGLINGSGHPEVTWQKGIGYERLWISDGLLLQYYAGGAHASGILTYAPGSITSQSLNIGGVHYAWNAAVDTNAPDGSAAHPWLAAPGTNPIQAMANLINFNGIRGIDFSTALGGPNAAYSATTAGGPPATQMTITATSEGTDGNALVTTETGSFLSWGAATLTGGGVHALFGCTVPPIAKSDNSGASTNTPFALANVSSYVLVSIAFTQAFYFILPGEITIDPLNFASKESNPDNIIDMLTVGDQVIICGNGSTENWYATGNLAAPFAPVEGRVYQRGVLAGTPTVVKDDFVIVGDDGVVYAIGYQFGTTAQWGVHRISTHGIEERIRTQLRFEQGLTP